MEDLEQLNIFNFGDLSEDPIYVKLQNITRGEEINFHGVTVRVNDYGIFEVEDEYMHESFRDINMAYKCILSLVETTISGEDD